MIASTGKLQPAEQDLKQLMADVARAVEKAQQAVARITGKATAVAAETEAASSSLYAPRPGTS
jgi:t-SNARE complex subunit (syntaxin)